MSYALHESDATPDRLTDGVTEARRLFDEESGCTHFSQRVLRFPAGPTGERTDAGADEVLYVLEGSANATIDGHEHALRPGGSVYVARGTAWSLDVVEALALLSVLVHDPAPPTQSHAVTEIDREPTHGATAGRQFALGVGPEQGCASVTQFVGFVPPGRAPDHFHAYDEVIYVLDGEGVLHIDGGQAPLRPGTAVHLPARLVHCLENSGEGELHLLGVFRPGGSPAEAYYPDGTLAVVPEE